jgi:DNA helicase INO80
MSDLFKLTDSKTKVENLMNLMMQFRKVCNHPELFERRPQRSPFTFRDYSVRLGPLDSGFN